MRSFISEIATKGTAGNHPNTSPLLRIAQALTERAKSFITEHPQERDFLQVNFTFLFCREKQPWNEDKGSERKFEWP